MIWRRWIERDDFRYSPVLFWPQQNKRLYQVLKLPAELQRHSNVELRAWKDQRCIVYLVSSGGIGKAVCLNFDAYAPVSRFESIAYAQLQIRGCLPRLQSDAEHLRDISPAPEPFELAVFDPHEVQDACFKSMQDLYEISDAEQLSIKDPVLKQWLNTT